MAITDYHTYGCPKCGAKHRFGHLAGYRDCYACWYEFNPETHDGCKPVRLYNEYRYEPLPDDFEAMFYELKSRAKNWFPRNWKPKCQRVKKTKAQYRAEALASLSTK